MSEAPNGAWGPLQGVKIVACSTAQAGTVPYMLMADLGAEVIKIEAPGKRRTTRARSTRLPGHAEHLLLRPTIAALKASRST